jgi:hypothetical protein
LLPALRENQRYLVTHGSTKFRNRVEARLREMLSALERMSD